VGDLEHMPKKQRRELEIKDKKTKAEVLALANDLPLETVHRILRKVAVEKGHYNEPRRHKDDRD